MIRLIIPALLLILGWAVLLILARRNERKVRSDWENLLGGDKAEWYKDTKSGIENNTKLIRMTMKEAIARFGNQHISQTERAERIVELFEELAEPHLIQPTFITDFPKPISPLSKASPSDPSVAERFEFFVGALETANGFSELNDPEEQYQRFKEQAQQRERGDEEAMVMDEDYIRALSYGMPPAAGIGVGIDRLTMLIANKHSIRDVILFPHLRPEKQEGSRQEAEGRKQESVQ